MLFGRVGFENFLDRFAKDLADFERERKARRVLSGFECDDGLSRDTELVGQFGLRPVVLGA